MSEPRYFVRKPLAVLHIVKSLNLTKDVEAMQFTGGQVNGRSIVDWINETSDQFAVWVAAKAPIVLEDGEEVLLTGRPEKIHIDSPDGMMSAKPMDYIIRDFYGNFHVRSPKLFNDTYREGK